MGMIPGQMWQYWCVTLTTGQWRVTSTLLSIRLCCRIPGLGTQLVSKATDQVTQAGVKALTTVATSHFSGKIFQKQGFDLLSEVSYNDYKVDGKVVFPITEPHTHVRLFLKKVV